MPDILSSLLPDRWQAFYAPFRKARKELTSGVRTIWAVSGRSSFGRPIPQDHTLDHDYFVSTDDGIYRRRQDQLVRVFPLWTFGMAMDEDRLYAACADHSSTFLLSLNRRALREERHPLDARMLYREPFTSSSHRIHQICLDEDESGVLWMAETGRNTLTKFDLGRREIIERIAPFQDSFGWPVEYDNHHINSVWSGGDYLLFVAYRTGGQSLIGILGDERLRGYAYPNVGGHDIYLRGEDVYFSDTFGQNTEERGGFLLRNGTILAEDAFREPPGYIVRGLAGAGEELLVGHSHKGTRQKRFEGEASLLILREDQLVGAETMPFSQTYDILLARGSTFEESSSLVSFERACERLEASFGDPVYDVEPQPLEAEEPGGGS